MKLTIDFNENNIPMTLKALENSGFEDLAKAIGQAYLKAQSDEVIRNAKKDFKKTWTRGYYFKHSDGNVTVLYFNYHTRQFSNTPFCVNGVVLGSPQTLTFIESLRERFVALGFKEV